MERWNELYFEILANSSDNQKFFKTRYKYSYGRRRGQKLENDTRWINICNEKPKIRVDFSEDEEESKSFQSQLPDTHKFSKNCEDFLYAPRSKFDFSASEEEYEEQSVDSLSEKTFPTLAQVSPDQIKFDEALITKSMSKLLSTSMDRVFRNYDNIDVSEYGNVTKCCLKNGIENEIDDGLSENEDDILKSSLSPHSGVNYNQNNFNGNISPLTAQYKIEVELNAIKSNHTSEYGTSTHETELSNINDFKELEDSGGSDIIECSSISDVTLSLTANDDDDDDDREEEMSIDNYIYQSSSSCNAVNMFTNGNIEKVGDSIIVDDVDPHDELAEILITKTTYKLPSTSMGGVYRNCSDIDDSECENITKSSLINGMENVIKKGSEIIQCSKNTQDMSSNVTVSYEIHDDTSKGDEAGDGYKIFTLRSHDEDKSVGLVHNVTSSDISFVTSPSLSAIPSKSFVMDKVDDRSFYYECEELGECGNITKSSLINGMENVMKKGSEITQCSKNTQDMSSNVTVSYEIHDVTSEDDEASDDNNTFTLRSYDEDKSVGLVHNVTSSDISFVTSPSLSEIPSKSFVMDKIDDRSFYYECEELSIDCSSHQNHSNCNENCNDIDEITSSSYYCSKCFGGKGDVGDCIVTQVTNVLNGDCISGYVINENACAVNEIDCDRPSNGQTKCRVNDKDLDIMSSSPYGDTKIQSNYNNIVTTPNETLIQRSHKNVDHQEKTLLKSCHEDVGNSNEIFNKSCFSSFVGRSILENSLKRDKKCKRKSSWRVIIGDNNDDKVNVAGACSDKLDKTLGHFIDSNEMEVLCEIGLESEKKSIQIGNDKDSGEFSYSEILRFCGQKKILHFASVFTRKWIKSCCKIGEGAFAEVYEVVKDNEAMAIKVVPVKIHDDDNGDQQTLREILFEMTISRELVNLKDETRGFVDLKNVWFVSGKYPKTLLDAWDKYSIEKKSENERPEFSKEQHYVVLGFEMGGVPLENFPVKNHLQVISIVQQVSLSLAIAEKRLNFEHRDLHLGNMLVKSVESNSFLEFFHLGKRFELPSRGIKVIIIDYTLSRITKNGCTFFKDLSTDEGLFDGQGDIQYDVYRDMKDVTGNNWKYFWPATNTLWLKHLINRFAISAELSFNHQSELAQSISTLTSRIGNELQDCNSASEFVKKSFLFAK